MFGLMIFIHELGHFVTARIFKVRVNEFALGMGPVIFKKTAGDTQYSIRLLPIGGFCAMEGEDEESPSEGSLMKKPVWQRAIIMSAGAFMNLMAGFIILLLLFAPAERYLTNEITGFAEGFPYRGESMLLEGDRILKIDGYNIYTYSDISLFFTRGAGKPYDILVARGGEKVMIKDLPLAQREYMTEVQTENGVEEKPVLRFGLDFKISDARLGDKIRLAWYNSVDFVRMVKVTLFDLFSGRASISELSGPVGITSALSQTAKTSMQNMWMFVALIAINLGVINLLPLPALDGGRILFLLVELVRRKPLNPKYEGMIHFVGLILFFLLMLYVSYNDIVRIIKG